MRGPGLLRERWARWPLGTESQTEVLGLRYLKSKMRPDPPVSSPEYSPSETRSWFPTMLRICPDNGIS